MNTDWEMQKGTSNIERAERRTLKDGEYGGALPRHRYD